MNVDPLACRIPATMTCRFPSPRVLSTRLSGIFYLWDQALYGEQLLPARLRDLLFKPNLDNYGYGWGILVPKPGAPYASESIPMHGGAIFGFQSLIERIVQHREVIILLDNTDSPKLLEIGQQIRQVLANNP
jgi:CubicO group peptidase (beta-lactamase class C family)